LRGRPRDARCDAAIVDATTELLAEVGYDALSMEAVAARADVAKTTLYRRWASKPELVADVFEQRARLASLDVPDTGTLRGDLAAHVRDVRDRLVHTPSGRAILGLVAAAGREPELARLLRDGFVAVRRAALGELVDRAVARGQARAGLDVDLVVDLLVAPVYYRLLVSGQPVADAFLDAVVDVVVGYISPG
jgi:AcrR family transcriptional regulator